MGRKSININAANSTYDAVVIATAHDSVDHNKIAQLGRCVIDSRNAILDSDIPITKA
jgi:UDP-N-acetyl-D-mannosaminuronate dehydrogenase